MAFSVSEELSCTPVEYKVEFEPGDLSGCRTIEVETEFSTEERQTESAV